MKKLTMLLLACAFAIGINAQNQELLLKEVVHSNSGFTLGDTLIIKYSKTNYALCLSKEYFYDTCIVTNIYKEPTIRKCEQYKQVYKSTGKYTCYSTTYRNGELYSSFETITDVYLEPSQTKMIYKEGDNWIEKTYCKEHFEYVNEFIGYKDKEDYLLYITVCSNINLSNVMGYEIYKINKDNLIKGHFAIDFKNYK